MCVWWFGEDGAMDGVEGESQFDARDEKPKPRIIGVLANFVPGYLCPDVSPAKCLIKRLNQKSIAILVISCRLGLGKKKYCLC